MKLDAKIKLQLVLLFICMSSLLSSLLIIADKTRPEHYKVLFALPLTFFVLNIMFVRIYNYMTKSVGLLILFLTLYLRSVVIPTFMCLGKYNEYLFNLDVYKYGNFAIFLMMYELFIIFLVSYLYGRKIYSEPTQEIIINKFDILNERRYHIGILAVILVIYDIICLIIYPQLKNNYIILLIVDRETDIAWNLNYLYMYNSVPGYIRQSFFLSVAVLRIILITFILNRIKIKYKNKNEIWPVTLSLIVILVNLSIVPPDRAINVYISFAMLFVMTKLYPRSKKTLVLIGVLCLSFFIVFTLFFKTILWDNNSPASMHDIYRKFSSVLQSYFSGPSNTSVSIYMAENNNYDKFKVFIVDILSWVPILAYFFKDAVIPTTTKLFNFALYDYDSIIRTDQIIPLIGQGYYFFGLFFAPILSVFILIITMKFDKAIMKEKRIEYYIAYVIGAVISGVTIVCYNLSIFTKLILEYFVPLYFLLNIRLKPLKNKNIIS